MTGKKLSLGKKTASGNVRSGLDAVIIFGGLMIIFITGILFVILPNYGHGSNRVRRPFWDPPSYVIREPGQGLMPEDIARLDRDPIQRERIKGLKAGIRYQPSPTWVGGRGSGLPANGLLIGFLASVAGYIFALRQRGIL